jgi:hypothetical protein
VTSRQHDGDGFGRLKAEVLKAHSHGFGVFVKLLVGNDFPFILIAVKADMGTVGMGFGMPMEDLNESVGGIGNSLSNCGLFFMGNHGNRGFTMYSGTENSAEKVARRFYFGISPLREYDFEMVFRPREKFHSGETVKPKVLVEGAVEPHCWGDMAFLMAFNMELSDKFKKSFSSFCFIVGGRIFILHEDNLIFLK